MDKQRTYCKKIQGKQNTVTYVKYTQRNNSANEIDSAVLKNLTKEEQLEYENMKLRIENEMLKKGFLMKGDGTIVKFTK